MNSFNLIALIIFTLTALTSVNGLRCYKCNSLSKPYCSDPYDPPDTGAVALEYQADCDKEIDKVVRNETHQGLAPHVDRNGSQYVAVCRKVVQKVENVVRVFRSCGWFDAASEEPICSQRTGSLGVTHTHCVCRGDLCNQGVIPQSTSIILLLTIPLFTLGFINSLTNTLV
ncbi:uncharacterized protein LOC107371601 isoform X1 [Tetranychus urticae]|uniref:Uncharacterized protein n=1 Tax=Tetranychus urticae TaxID=32264 RepID=T1JV53_TETUR|nr:uncharacterized protein LOC107371601 isoform X1 [Tetranychus urticae]